MKIIPTRLVARISLSLSLALSLSLSSFIHPSPLPRSPFSRSLSLAFPLLIPPHGGSDAKSCSRHRLPCTEMSIPRRADVNSTKSLLSRGRNRVSRFYSIFVRCGKTRNHVVARSTIGSFRLVQLGICNSIRGIDRACEWYLANFFIFFLTSPTFSSIRFRSRRRPPPPRCRRFFGSALLETFDLEPLFLTPFIELTGISPCFCITLRRWKTDSVVSRRSNTYTYTQKRSASSERVTPPKIFQKAYRAFRIPLSFAFLPFSRCSFPGITFIQFRFKVIHTRDN